MNEPLDRQFTAGSDLYYTVYDPATAKHFDFADDTWKGLVQKAINAVTTGGAGSGAFRVSGDVTASLVVGKKIRVRGSTGNDGLYTIRSGSAYSAPNTTINVSEAVADGTVDGTLDLNATPYVSATEQTLSGGDGLSNYHASLDLADLNNTGTLGNYLVQLFEQAGADPDPLADSAVSGAGSLVVQFGKLGERHVRVKAQPHIESTNGNQFLIAAWLEVDGEVWIDATATCQATVVQHDSDSATPQFPTVSTVNFGAPNIDGRFEYTKTTPGFDDDRSYYQQIRIVENGKTWKLDDPFNVLP